MNPGYLYFGEIPLQYSVMDELIHLIYVSNRLQPVQIVSIVAVWQDVENGVEEEDDEEGLLNLVRRLSYERPRKRARLSPGHQQVKQVQRAILLMGPYQILPLLLDLEAMQHGLDVWRNQGFS